MLGWVRRYPHFSRGRVEALEAQKQVVKTSIENCSMSRDWMLSSLASKALFSLLNAKCSCCQKIFLRYLKPNSVFFKCSIH